MKDFLTPSRIEKLEKIEAFRSMKAPKFHTADAVIEFANLLKEARQSILSSFSDEEANGFAVPTGNGWAMSSLEPNGKGRWRVTYFHYLEPDEPVGHTEYLSRDDAINGLLCVYSTKALTKIREFI